MLSSGLAKMSEFEGRVPEIEINSSCSGIFTYVCKKYNRRISRPCRMNFITFEDCYDCLGFNLKFERLYLTKTRCCGCGMRLDYGYFMLIYLLEKAGLLPKDFKMLCCICRGKDSKD